MNKTGKETLAYRSLRCFKQVLNYKLQKGKKNMLGKINKQKEHHQNHSCHNKLQWPWKKMRDKDRVSHLA